MRLSDIEEAELEYHGMGNGVAFDPYLSSSPAWSTPRHPAYAQQQTYNPYAEQRRNELDRVRDALRAQEQAMRAAQAQVEEYQRLLQEQQAAAQNLQDMMEEQSYVSQYQPPAPERQAQIIEDAEELPLAFIRRLKPVQGQVLNND